MQRLRETLTIVLLGLLPVHAVLVTTDTKLVLGPGFSPLPMLAAWKEGLLALILLIALVEIVKRILNSQFSILNFDVLDICIAGLLFLGIITTLYHGVPSVGRLVIAVKYDFVALGTFLVLRRVPWSEQFFAYAYKVIIAIGALVASYGILTLLLPDSFFRLLGYSDAHSLYIVNKPLAAFQQIAESGVRRIQSTMSGPNQLGLWLLIPYSFGLFFVFRLFVYRSAADRITKNELTKNCLFLVLVGTALFFSFSRSAWIGAFFMMVTIIGLSLPRALFKKFLIYGAAACVLIGIVVTLAFPKVFFRLSSSRGHIEHPIEAWHRMWASPLGEGLGAVGPASARGSDTCVILRPPGWVFLSNRQHRRE